MCLLSRLAVLVTAVFALAQTAHADSKTLTISYAFGPKSEIPDPRAGYNGWLSNQVGVTETLMGIDYDLNLYPRLAERVEQASPTKWRVTLRDGVKFHDGTAMTAQTVADSISTISSEGNAGHNKRIAKLLGLASVSADGDKVVVFETQKPNAAFPGHYQSPALLSWGPLLKRFLLMLRALTSSARQFRNSFIVQKPMQTTA